MIAVGGQAAEVGGARGRQLGHQSARFGGTWTPTPGISRRVSAIRRFMSSIPTGDAQPGASWTRPSWRPVRQNPSAVTVAISAGSSP